MGQWVSAYRLVKKRVRRKRECSRRSVNEGKKNTELFKART